MHDVLHGQLLGTGRLLNGTLVVDRHSLLGVQYIFSCGLDPNQKTKTPPR